MRELSRRQALLCTFSQLLSSLPNSTNAATELASANRSFSFELFKKTTAAHQKGNVLISPFSVFLALSMVSNGASQKFYPSPGQAIIVKMMHQSSDIKHFKGTGFASVSLPYQGGKQSMCIFLPDIDSDIESFQAQLSEENWNKWMSSYTTEQVALSLPKLKLNFEDSLENTLEAMGMKAAFKASPGTFLNLVPSQYLAWISKIIHKTFMDVTEEGTEAAAATAVVMNFYKVRTAPPIMRPTQFTVERPFMLALVDNASGEILFLGKILKP